MVTVVVLEFSVMRCQPLRRALCTQEKKCTHLKLTQAGISRLN
ncbi:acetyltransferase [Vibrio cholerae]|nr:acetyltransferase [Vibrio cholerae]